MVFYSQTNKRFNSSKHIEIKYLVLKDKFKEGQTVIEHMDIEAMITNPLTKGLSPKFFNEHVDNMGVPSSCDVLG